MQKKICRHKMSIMFNEICINEEMLPKYTYIYIYIYIYIYNIYIYIYIYVCVCVSVCIYIYILYIYIYMEVNKAIKSDSMKKSRKNKIIKI